MCGIAASIRASIRALALERVCCLRLALERVCCLRLALERVCVER